LFFEQVLAEARERGLTSDEHFTVDGTLVEAWAGLKSFKRKDGSDGQIPPDDPGNPTVNFHGEKRSNDTHQSTTDPDARLATKQRSRFWVRSHAGAGSPSVRTRATMWPALWSSSFLTPRRCYLSYLFQNKLLQVVLEAESWLRRVGIAPIFSAEDRMNFMRGFSAAC